MNTIKILSKCPAECHVQADDNHRQKLQPHVQFISILQSLK